MKSEISRGEVWNVLLDPVKGSEQAGMRPCVVVSPDSKNRQLETIIVVPLSTKSKDWPTRVQTEVEGTKGQALCEQIRTVAKTRFKSRLGKLRTAEIVQIRLVLRQMLFD